jgi:hypothetical protein
MSEVKVNKISPRTACGTVTLGDSGDTFTIPAGATINNQGTAVNFGATGSASWVTTVKTTGFTAVAGEGYFCNTTSGGFSVNLPAGTAGAVVAIKDYAGTFDTGTLTLVQNGSDKIGGSTVNATLTTEGIAVTLVFIDSTQGWLVTDSGLQDEAPTALYMTATSPCVATVGDYKIHTFTGPGTFTVCSVGNPAGSDSVDYVVVAGGGAGGSTHGGGGGAGGYREGYNPGSYTASPLATTALPVSVQGYTITVGGGAPTAPTTGDQKGAPGSASTFSTITSAGGGGGGGGGGGNGIGLNGGSGGGGGNTNCSAGGTGNSPPTSPSQGKDGGAGNNPGGTGGGGGATVVGVASPGGNTSGPGGDGATSSINNTPTARAGGGGGGNSSPSSNGAGGAGGGGVGAKASPAAGGAGTVNTGGGGGGGGSGGAGGGGGSGIIIIRYKFQN